MIDLQTQQELGRAKNAVQDYLIHKLLYPKVYLDADWNGGAVDVLAVDREGSGDVHAVCIVSACPHFVPPELGHELTMVTGNDEFDSHLKKLKDIPGHYRYLAAMIAGSRLKEYYAGSRLQQAALADDGVGRIGILFLDLTGDDPKSQVRVVLKAERFRSSKEIVELADHYVAEHPANWELRE